MLLSLDVTYKDGTTVTAEIFPDAVVAFERQFDVPVTGLSTETRMEWLCYLAWAALHPASFAGTFEAFVKAVGNVEPAGDEAADAAPLAPTA